MKPKKIITILILIIVFIGLIWYFFLRTTEQQLTLSTEKPTIGEISTSVTATGTIQPVDTVSVGTQVSGTIAALYADFNSTVKKGQLLAELDKTLIQADVDKANANLAQAKSNENYQSTTFARQQKLFDSGSISKAEYELALNNYQVAKTSVTNAEAQLRSAQRNLSFTSIYSPIDGVVLGRSVNIGQTVAASFNTPTIFTIAKDITKMQVVAKVDEADIGAIEKGQRSTFTVDAFVEDTFNGTVKDIRLQPSISSNVVTYSTLIDAPNDDQKLKPGMTASIVIYTKEIEGATLVSAKALNYQPDAALASQYQLIPIANAESNPPSAGEGTVWVVEGNKIVQKKIKTGLNNNTQVEVISGLTPNDVIATGTQNQVAAFQGAASSPFLPKRPARK
ncbi:efflux RND transporter periplasmic adaptor subunit [Albibacterium sp.]|uniref:efflux RND transporter periplasmic adaptor subunit n=1 Tax=Albibacterium sp. TaxID=2952885 RepID=UPI002B60ED4C|nr:efflux RND transporter periplasmic adaptor subunit [Albibacterium sp.]HUH20015.1 efflux RND transporter periplasmic adaptor subunit [Albibacterium sp.]